MKKTVADVIREWTATAGTGTVTLQASTGWARFSDRFADTERVHYSIRDGVNWELGYGTYVAPNQLARTTILGTLAAGTWTTGGAALTLASGQAVVRCVAPETLYTNAWRVEPTLVASPTTMAAGGCYIVQANSLTLTLPASPAVGDRVQITNGATVTGTIVDPGAEKINATAGTMTIDLAEFAFTLTYVDSAYGWKVMA